MTAQVLPLSFFLPLILPLPPLPQPPLPLSVSASRCRCRPLTSLSVYASLESLPLVCAFDSLSLCLCLFVYLSRSICLLPPSRSDSLLHTPLSLVVRLSCAFPPLAARVPPRSIHPPLLLAGPTPHGASPSSSTSHRAPAPSPQQPPLPRVVRDGSQDVEAEQALAHVDQHRGRPASHHAPIQPAPRSARPITLPRSLCGRPTNGW